MLEYDGMSAFKAVDSRFDSWSGHTKGFRKLVFTASYLVLSIKKSGKNMLVSLLVVSLGKAFNRNLPLCVVERW